MYYYLLTLVIIIFYLSYFYRDKLLQMIRRESNTQNENQKKSQPNNTIEHFDDLPTFDISNTNKTSKNMFRNRELDVSVKLNLVYPDPQYQYDKKQSILGDESQNKQFTWKTIFKKNICHSDLGKCGCQVSLDDKNICGITQGDKVYECASPCPECKQCHFQKDRVELNYEDFCYLSKTKKEKKRCQDYQDRILFTMKNCFGSESVDRRIIPIDDKCKIFLPVRFNSYVVGEDIFFHLENKFMENEAKNQVKYININNLTFETVMNSTEITINNFYQTREETYFFVEAKENLIGTNIKASLSLSLVFKDKKTPHLVFNLIQIINIYPSMSRENNELNISRQELLNLQRDKYLVSQKIRFPKFSVESIDEDRFASNYLGENKYYQCHKINNYTVTNPIKDKPLLEYERSDLLDNPANWKNRFDINRPWDYIIE